MKMVGIHTDATVGERGGIGFLLNEQFAREFLNHTTLAVVFDEGIVLLGSALGQRLEPVGIVGDAHLHGPLLHAGSYCIGDGTVQTSTIVNHINHLVVNLSGQVFIHLLLGEDILAEKL